MMKIFITTLFLICFASFGMAQTDLSDIPTNKAAGTDSIFAWEINKLVTFMQDSVVYVYSVDDSADARITYALTQAKTISGNWVNTANPWALNELISTVIAEGENATLLDGTNWRVLYVNGSGDVTELALGADGTYLKSNGASAAPTFDTPAGSGDMLKADMRDSVYAYLADSIGVSVQADLGNTHDTSGELDALYEGELDNSAGLAAALSDETGTGVVVFATSPTLVTPALGTPSALVLTNATGIVDAGIVDNTIQEPALNVSNSPTDNYVLSYNQAGTNFTWAVDATGGAPATADISDVSVTQTELAELETIGSTSISADDWTAVAAMSGINTGDATNNVTDNGSGTDNEILIYTGDGVAEGDPDLTFDGDTLTAKVYKVGSGGIVSVGNITIGNGATSAGVLTIQEDTDDGTNNATFTVPTLAADTDYILPPDDGDNTEVLQTDGSGTLTWVANSGGAPATADISDVSVTQTELAELEAIGATTISAAQWTGLGAATTAGIALWDDAAASNQRTTLGLVIGTDVQADLGDTHDTSAELDALYEGELTNSAGLLAALSDETGTGVAVFGTAPTFTTSITIGSAGISEAELEILDGATITTAELNVLVPDTLTWNWGVMDTVITGDLVGWKVPYAITVVKVSAYTDANTTTFNLEERAAATPNVAGTDMFGSDMIAVSTALDSTSFTNAGFAKDTWMCPTISATGDVARFGVTVRYIKQ